jgi:hypothetical protein
MAAEDWVAPAAKVVGVDGAVVGPAEEVGGVTGTVDAVIAPVGSALGTADPSATVSPAHSRNVPHEPQNPAPASLR